MARRKYTGFEGMDEYLAALDTCMEKAPGRVADELIREGRQVVTAYRRAVKPHRKTGRLSSGMRYQKGVTKKGDSYANTVYNEARRAPHFHLVEYGHEQVLGGKKGKRGIVVGRVDGLHLFENTIDREEPKLMKSRERMVEKLFRELE